jgi:hypothetical protein
MPPDRRLVNPNLPVVTDRLRAVQWPTLLPLGLSHLLFVNITLLEIDALLKASPSTAPSERRDPPWLARRPRSANRRRLRGLPAVYGA